MSTFSAWVAVGCIQSAAGRCGTRPCGSMRGSAVVRARYAEVLDVWMDVGVSPYIIPSVKIESLSEPTSHSPHMQYAE